MGGVCQQIRRVSQQALGIPCVDGQAFVDLGCLIRGQRLRLHEVIHIKAVGILARHTAAAGVALLQVAQVAQVRHFVANGGAGHSVRQKVAQGFGADRLACLDVILNNQAEYGGSAFTKHSFHRPLLC